MAEHEVVWWVDLSVNAPPVGWRMKLGERLRDWADELDRRRSLAVSMLTYPQISDADQIDVIRQGIKEMRRALHDAAENEATERKWREVEPEMWNG